MSPYHQGLNKALHKARQRAMIRAAEQELALFFAMLELRWRS